MRCCCSERLVSTGSCISPGVDKYTCRVVGASPSHRDGQIISHVCCTAPPLCLVFVSEYDPREVLFSARKPTCCSALHVYACHCHDLTIARQNPGFSTVWANLMSSMPEAEYLLKARTAERRASRNQKPTVVFETEMVSVRIGLLRCNACLACLCLVDAVNKALGAACVATSPPVVRFVQPVHPLCWRCYVQDPSIQKGAFALSATSSANGLSTISSHRRISSQGALDLTTPQEYLRSLERVMVRFHLDAFAGEFLGDTAIELFENCGCTLFALICTTCELLFQQHHIETEKYATNQSTGIYLQCEPFS